MLILPHAAIPIPLPALGQIAIDDTAAHALPAGAGADEVPGDWIEGRCCCYIIGGLVVRI
jgi:hypothetical protein